MDILAARRPVGAGLVAAAALAGVAAPTPARAASFPFGTMLVLDAAPLPGSRRVPVIEIDENGSASFYLWCSRVRGSANVGDAVIRIVPTTPLPSQCTPEQISRDAGLLAELAQVTGWRRRGNEIDLFGAATLRFRLMTN